MSALESFLGGFWSVLGTGLVHGTALALVTALLSLTLLRRAQPALLAALWTIALVKFLLPVGPALPVSLSSVLGSLLEPELAAGAMTAPGAAPVAAASATGSDTLALVWLGFQLAVILVYVAIVVRLLVVRGAAQRAHRRWALALPEASQATTAIAWRAAAIVGQRRLPPLRVSRDLAAPQLIGLLRPILVIPAHLDGSTAPATLEAALLHEIAHLRRRDTWVRAVQILGATLLFFWPVVHWVNRRIDEHREIACDRWAIACGRLSPEEYARTLVGLARRAALAPASALASAGLGIALVRGRKQLEARVAALVASRASRGFGTARLGPAWGALLVLWATVSLAGARDAPATLTAEPVECVIEPGVVEYILATFPEADADGDGELSRDEVCAQQRRLRERWAEDDEVTVTSDQQAVLALNAYLEKSKLDCVACSCADTESAPLMPLEKRMCTADTAEP